MKSNKKFTKKDLTEMIRKVIREEYQGWTNFDTWAAAFYMNNEEPLNSALYKYRGKLTVDILKRIFSQLARYNREGYKEINQKKVNWQEIVDDENNKQ